MALSKADSKVFDKVYGDRGRDIFEACLTVERAQKRGVRVEWAVSSMAYKFAEACHFGTRAMGLPEVAVDRFVRSAAVYAEPNFSQRDRAQLGAILEQDIYVSPMLVKVQKLFSQFGIPAVKLSRGENFYGYQAEIGEHTVDVYYFTDAEPHRWTVQVTDESGEFQIESFNAIPTMKQVQQVIAEV